MVTSSVERIWRTVRVFVDGSSWSCGSSRSCRHIGQECHGRGALSQPARAGLGLRETGSGWASPVEEAEPQPSRGRARDHADRRPSYARARVRRNSPFWKPGRIERSRRPSVISEAAVRL